MKYEKKIKESWVDNVMNELQPLFKEIAFRRSGKIKYIRKEKECECRYLMSIRHPKYSDDPHQLYLNPCIHVYLPEIEDATSKLTGKPLNKNFPTLGGSLGLYTIKESLHEWPVDDEQSALALIPQLEMDIRNIAVPFWDLLSTKLKILDALESKHKWAKHADYWKYHFLVILYLEEGVEDAMEHVKNNAKKFWEFDHRTLRENLLSIERLK